MDGWLDLQEDLGRKLVVESSSHCGTGALVNPQTLPIAFCWQSPHLVAGRADPETLVQEAQLGARCANLLDASFWPWRKRH